MFSGLTTFSFPTTIHFGPGAVADLSEYLKEMGIKKPLVVTDQGIVKTSILVKIKEALANNETPYALFDKVQQNPLASDVDGALKAYRAGNCDGVVGLGGGSSLDAAKVLTVLAANQGPLTRYDCQQGGHTNIQGPLPPMIAIPTTAGTGSEVGRCSVITDLDQGRKFMICHPLMMPSRAILDPELTVGLPPDLTAATGMDALTHNLEALVVTDFHPMCDAIALKGIELVALYLERAVKTPADIEARGHMMIAAMMGAVAFQKDLGAAHSLAHPLSTLCHIQHGLANAVCIPHVMAFNKKTSQAQYALVAGSFGVDTAKMTDEEAAQKAIEAVIDLNDRIGVPKSLAMLGVKEEQLDELSQKAFLDSCHLANPRQCTQEDFKMLYKKAFLGSFPP